MKMSLKTNIRKKIRLIYLIYPVVWQKEYWHCGSSSRNNDAKRVCFVRSWSIKDGSKGIISKYVFVGNSNSSDPPNAAASERLLEKLEKGGLN